MSAATNKRREIWLKLITLLLPLVYYTLPARAANDAANLRDKGQSLAQQLNHNQFQREIYLDSTELEPTLKGEIFAVVDFPFATVNNALNDPVQGLANWCDILILHLNTKYCRASSSSKGDVLSVNIGKKVEQELVDAYRMQFAYRVAAVSAEYFQVELNADSGPLGTKDYRIVLEAVAIKGDRTFMHLSYSYGYGISGRIALLTYLATTGSHKVGFTSINDQSSTEIKYIGGVRGMVERNAMRYYLAIDAYLSALSSVPERRLEQRLTNWFNATEQYARQLHEVERQDYMQMKYAEYRRQQTER